MVVVILGSKTMVVTVILLCRSGNHGGPRWLWQISGGIKLVAGWWLCHDGCVGKVDILVLHAVVGEIISALILSHTFGFGVKNYSPWLKFEVAVKGRGRSSSNRTPIVFVIYASKFLLICFIYFEVDSAAHSLFVGHINYISMPATTRNQLSPMKAVSKFQFGEHPFPVLH
ncbi:hypothetical protein LguiA_024967 [Lonicera macranthoides]